MELITEVPDLSGRSRCLPANHSYAIPELPQQLFSRSQLLAAAGSAPEKGTELCSRTVHYAINQHCKFCGAHHTFAIVGKVILSFETRYFIAWEAAIACNFSFISFIFAPI